MQNYLFYLSRELPIELQVRESSMTTTVIDLIIEIYFNFKDNTANTINAKVMVQ